MIRDSLAAAEKYLSLGVNFAKAFDFLRTHDLAALPVGRQEIDGANCYANVVETELKPLTDEMTFEAHRRYYDIQVPVTGSETMGVMKFPEAHGDYNESGDCYLFPGRGELVTVTPGEFIVFDPPTDAHAPCYAADAPRRLKKVIVKVRVDVV